MLACTFRFGHRILQWVGLSLIWLSRGTRPLLLLPFHNLNKGLLFFYFLFQAFYPVGQIVLWNRVDHFFRCSLLLQVLLGGIVNFGWSYKEDSRTFRLYTQDLMACCYLVEFVHQHISSTITLFQTIRIVEQLWSMSTSSRLKILVIVMVFLSRHGLLPRWYEANWASNIIDLVSNSPSVSFNLFCFWRDPLEGVLSSQKVYRLQGVPRTWLVIVRQHSKRIGKFALPMTTLL